MATTAERLKEIMRMRHLKQIDIIRLAEPYCKQYNLILSKSDMSQFVSGKVTPGQWKISLLSKALNVNPAWLMGEDVSMEPVTLVSYAKQDDESFVLNSEEMTLVSAYRKASLERRSIVMQILSKQ